MTDDYALVVPDLDFETIAVTATLGNLGVWKLRYMAPCQACGERHQHGGGNGPEPSVDGSWHRHCPDSHRPFREDCVARRDAGGRKRCTVVHNAPPMVYLTLITEAPIE